MELLKYLQSSDWLTSLPLIGLYAESHFRFFIPFSRYYKREPELIFDVPWRLEPGQDLRLYLVIKDAHLFPVHLRSVDVEIHQAGRKIDTQHFDLDEDHESRQTCRIIKLERKDQWSGEIEILPSLVYVVDNRTLSMRIDNYKLLAKQAQRVTLAQDNMPQPDGWRTGDLHLHSSFTSDQIEFGATLEQLQDAAAFMGLDFLTATDHSYDLDDLVDDYTKNDPALVKWNDSRAQISKLNLPSDIPTILPGEEISVRNARGDTVHFLHYNDPTYYPGSGDSGEDWPKIRSELTIADVLEQRSPDSASVAAHSGYQFPWLQRFLLKRGWWESQDHEHQGLDGCQILCGTPASPSFHQSRELWIEALLKGHHLAAIGGSDGHGNMNRNWHVGMPVWSLGIHEDQIFGQVRTLLKSTSTSVPDLIQAIKACQTALTTGPVADLNIFQGASRAGIGETLMLRSKNQISAQVKIWSSEEFGLKIDVSLYAGECSSASETLLHYAQLSGPEASLELQFPSTAIDYVRLELASEGSRWPGVYVSSPIWISTKLEP